MVKNALTRNEKLERVNSMKIRGRSNKWYSQVEKGELFYDHKGRLLQKVENNTIRILRHENNHHARHQWIVTLTETAGMRVFS